MIGFRILGWVPFDFLSPDESLQLSLLDEGLLSIASSRSIQKCRVHGLDGNDNTCSSTFYLDVIPYLDEDLVKRSVQRGEVGNPSGRRSRPSFIPSIIHPS